MPNSTLLSILQHHPLKTITPAIDAEIVEDAGEYATVGGGEDTLDLPSAPTGKRGTKKKKRR